ncbi:pregnancy-specific beta-1-glycoprotein 7-like [Mantella aurantiaca]
MDRVGVGLACALLLLIQDGNGANLDITSPNPSPKILIRDPINLTIDYSSTPSLIIWTANDSVVAVWTGGSTKFADNYHNRATLQEKNLCINGSTEADSGEYVVSVTATNGDSGSLTIHVLVRDRVQEIQSNDTGIYKTGDNITLTIWYEGDPLGIYWNYDNSPLVIKSEVYNHTSPRFNGRMILNDTGSLLVYNTTKEDAGKYSVSVSTNFVPGSRTFQVTFYDNIQNVTVQQTPAIVDNRTPLVNMSCRASSGSGSVTWKKDGQPVNNDSTHTLLDQQLQILHPNNISSGNYSCNMSNPIGWNVGSLNLTVYYPVENVTVTQSPQTVSEKTPVVDLICSASSGNMESVKWMKDGLPIGNDYKLSDENKTLQIIKPTRTFSGNYSCNISNAAYWGSAFLQLRVHDPVVSVKVTQSPQNVNNKTPLVKLSCSASSGYIEEVTWTKDGKSVTTGNKYSLLDEKRTLQITAPNKTFSGNYTCNMSNAAYSDSGWLNLTVSRK